MKRIKVIISGGVQGVFFRAFIQDNAVELSVNGYVKNRDDGKVEAVFEGENAAVDKLVELCKKGPSAAEISGVKVEEDKFLNEYSEFSILR